MEIHGCARSCEISCKAVHFCLELVYGTYFMEFGLARMILQLKMHSLTQGMG